MRDILLAFNSEVTETTKYGMPCFCYRGKMFCYLWTDKKSNDPYFLLVEGNRLNHPQLEAGSRKRMKIFSVNPNEDLPLATIHEILKEALSLY
jgi:hypothetical protein